MVVATVEGSAPTPSVAVVDTISTSYEMLALSVSIAQPFIFNAAPNTTATIKNHKHKMK